MSAPTKVTLQDVARLAKVSPSTVSRILNGTAAVDDEKRKRVEQAVATLGFVPNPIARGLAGGRTHSIGVITQYIDSPFYGEAHRGIEKALEAAGFNALFVSGQWDAQRESSCIQSLVSRRVDGIIVLDGRLSDGALRRYAESLPIVITGRTVSDPRICSMQFDNFSGAELACAHLIGLGHTQICFITGDSQHQDGHERLRGFQAALKAHRLSPAAVLNGDFSEESGVAAIDQLLADGVRFTAVFAANDQMAIGATIRLHERGLRVPHDVSIVGFDDQRSSRFFIPALTTIHQPSHEIGALSVSAMLELLQDHCPAVEMPAPRLVVRDSTAPPPAPAVRASPARKRQGR